MDKAPGTEQAMNISTSPGEQPPSDQNQHLTIACNYCLYHLTGHFLHFWAKLLGGRSSRSPRRGADGPFPPQAELWAQRPRSAARARGARLPPAPLPAGRSHSGKLRRAAGIHGEEGTGPSKAGKKQPRG